MNDEITVKFGGDLSGFASATRSIKTMAKETAGEMKNIFKDVLGDVFTKGLAIAGIGNGAKNERS